MYVISCAYPPVTSLRRENLLPLLRLTIPLSQYFAQELGVVRLNRVHQHLWWAGLPIPACPLHDQVSIGRMIIITGREDLHLTWWNDKAVARVLNGPSFMEGNHFEG